MALNVPNLFLLLMIVMENAVIFTLSFAWPQNTYFTHNKENGLLMQGNPKRKPEGTKTPDLKDLVGLYEEEAPERDTNAYFMTGNNSVVTVQVGSTAALRCQVYDVAEHETISWIRRRGHHIITVCSNTYSNDDRFQVTHSKTLQDWTLHIHYAQPRDSGTYECQLTAHPPMSIFTQLNVIEAISEITGVRERYIQVGSFVHLVCTIRDLQEPPTYVFWYHGDKMINYDIRRQINVDIRDGRSELKIDKVRPSDSGNYTCLPSNARASSILLHVITGETPAAMQGASGTSHQHPVSFAFFASFLSIYVL